MSSVVKKQKILLPQNVDMNKWAVVACDQFTSQPEYWQQVEELVGDAPSTLRLILPEVYLQADNSSRIAAINKNMVEYLGKGILREAECFVLTERQMDDGGKRLGLVVPVDLEAYDYRRIRVPIRATEDTLPERLPARVQIRENAPIELPHILLLIDDREKSIIEPLYRKRESLKKIYDFDLNMNGGHITGYEIDDVDEIIKKFDALLTPELQESKYGCDAGIELAVGDGNHSMAAAKEYWKKVKATLSEEEILTHPARYVLVEVVNIYDDELVFEPINRIVNGADEGLIAELTDLLQGQEGKDETEVGFFFQDEKKTVKTKLSSGQTIKLIQEYLESRLKAKTGWKVDYVHGEQYTIDVAKASGGIGIIMPLFKKEELFNYVVNVGNLPKKSFSIGTAESKKYYIEAKAIKR